MWGLCRRGVARLPGYSPTIVTGARANWLRTASATPTSSHAMPEARQKDESPDDPCLVTARILFDKAVAKVEVRQPAHTGLSLFLGAHALYTDEAW